jgi:hypothetical protein
MNRLFMRHFIYLFIIVFTLLIGNQKTCRACNKVLSAQYLIHKSSNYHHSCYNKHIQIYCDQCSKKIDGSYNTSKDKNYHKSCFQQFIQKRCKECGDIISGIYNILEGKEYHESCYIEYILPKCDVCHQPVEDKYIKDFWGNYYHEYHDNKMPSCDNCNRLICNPLTRGGYSINSNRFVCNICKTDVIKNKSQLKNSLNNVLDILKTVGIATLPTGIPITLVDSREELISMSGNRLGNIQGYTNYEESTLAGRIINQKYHIYILSNLHEEIFEAVLAHELLHVYLFQNRLDLRSDIREGFCNLGSNLIYQHYRSQLSKYRIKTMNENTDPDYGIGYKKMKVKLDTLGWEKLLKKLSRL